MDTSLKKETLVSDCNELQKGQRVIYEGREAEVISVKPLLVIKLKNRVLCGALHNQIKFITGPKTHSYTP